MAKKNIVTIKLFDDTINEAEDELNKCWDILCSIKNYSPSNKTVHNLINFQEYLASPLSKLSKLHYKLVRYKKNLIKRKNELSKKWFKDKLKLIANFEEINKETIKIGKSLGDAFVWRFLDNDRTSLEELIGRETNFYLPNRIGGFGELEFIKSVKHINKNLVIYNSLTNLLTIGDFSLINLKNNKFVGFGEIKAGKSETNKLNLTIRLVGDETLKELEIPIKKNAQKEFNYELPKNIDEKLEKQSKKIITFLSKEIKEPDDKIKFYISDISSELKIGIQSIRDNDFYQKIITGNRLLVIYKNESLTLHQKFAKGKLKPNLLNKIDAFTQNAKDLLIEDSEKNHIMIGDLDPSRIMKSSRPIFWNSIDCEILRKIYFHDVLILFVYNIESLFQKLISIGFEVKYSKYLDEVLVTFKDGKKILEFNKLTHYINLILYHAMSEYEIIDIILKQKELVFSKNIKGPAKININMVNLFNPKAI